MLPSQAECISRRRTIPKTGKTRTPLCLKLIENKESIASRERRTTYVPRSRPRVRQTFVECCAEIRPPEVCPSALTL